MERETERRGPGRPPTKHGDYDPPRAAGRIGPVWDECVAQAKNDGQTMTAFVVEAITRELARRRRRTRRDTGGAGDST
jgi:hypothetical protein